MRHARTLWAAALLGCLVELGGCAKAPDPARILVLGLDGLDPEVVEQLGSEGRLPHLTRLRREGASGRLRVDPPLLSPVIWTTIATGAPPERHGIGHFTAQLADGQEVPVTSSLRRVKAVWNIFSDFEKRVAVVGWWATWPAESVRGVVVSDRTCYHFLSERGGDADDSQLIFPSTEATRALAGVARPESLDPNLLARFVAAPVDEIARPVAFGEDLGHFRWALAAGTSYSRIGFDLWQRTRPDLLMIYIEATDTASHLFGHLYRQRGLAGELAEQQRRFGRAVEETYVWADELVGRAIAAMDERTTLVVLSDHGFELGALPADPSKTRDTRRVSEKFHRELGSIFLFGHGVRAGVTLRDPRPVDVVPTLLALAGLPQADDLAGRPLLEAFPAGQMSGERRASFESTGEQKAAPNAASDAASDRAMLEKLRSLGYLAGAVRSQTSEKNLAALALRERRFVDAERAYRNLVAERPDDPGLQVGFASALAELGRTQDALDHFAAALSSDPLHVVAHYNRALLYERVGRRKEAVAGYRAALQIDSRHAASRDALARLGVPVSAASMRTASGERAADALVTEAGERMRRGDYDGADALLLRARELAPEAAPVHQQIANVAYLRGDLPQAIAALEKAIALDPTNPLLRTNLEKLKKRMAAPSQPANRNQP